MVSCDQRRSTSDERPTTKFRSNPVTRRALPAFCALALATLCAAQTVRSADSQPGSKTPRVTAVLDGPRTAVFQTPQDSCNPNDIPDAMARAFRDYTGTVHLVAASSELFQSLGPDLDSVQHSCEVGHYSAKDPNPADFNDQVWIDSFYTFDGKTIVGLGHTEYHGWQHPGECHSQNYAQCEYDSDTFHLSKDGGYHFNSDKAPLNFLAGVPYKYEIDRGPEGYSVDTNIIELNGWYYAVATDWTWPPNCSEQGGPHPCLVPNGG